MDRKDSERIQEQGLSRPVLRFEFLFVWTVSVVKRSRLPAKSNPRSPKIFARYATGDTI